MPELLKVYAVASLNEEKESKNLIKSFIIENYQEKPFTELKRANKEIDEMKLPEGVNKVIKEVKYCAANIKDHLDLQHITGMAMLKQVISELLEQGETNIRNLKSFSTNVPSETEPSNTKS